jgi:hypothetical protein
VVEDEQEDAVEDEEIVLEEDLSDEEADSASAGPVQWVVLPAWEVLANDRVGWRGGPCLVLYAPLAGRTLPAGEGGCAAGWLPPSHYLNNGPAVRCRSSPEGPDRD